MIAMNSMQFARRLAAAAALAVATAALQASPAAAAFGIESFSGGAFNEDGTSSTQAGAHPYSYKTDFRLPAAAFFLPDGQVKDIDVELPPGFVSNPSITPTKCTLRELKANICPVSSQVGIATPFVAFGPGVHFPLLGVRPVNNLVAPPGSPALLAFSAGGDGVIYIQPSVRTGGDYGITVRSPDTSQALPITGAAITLWGVPADASHDEDRGFPPGHPETPCANTPDPACSNPAGYERKAFVTNPANCAAGPLPTTMRVTSWQEPDIVHSASFSEDMNGTPMAVTGCDQVPFDPSITIRPTSEVPDSPTGLEVSITVPGQGLEGASSFAQAPVKRVAVTLPAGMSVSPSGADGLAACSPAQIALKDASVPTCPASSAIGSVTIDTPLLEKPMEGSVYLAKQADNPFNSLLAMYVVAEGPGVVVKLPGKVEADPTTGQLTTIFDNNPQLPFTKLTLRLKGGSRAPLATSPTCGAKTAIAVLTPWSGTPPVTLTDTSTINCPGVSGFSPAFAAGVMTPIAGSFSPFALRIDRPDNQEFMDGLTVKLPPGLLAKIKDVPLCTDAQAAAGACPAGSQIGVAKVGAGPGSNPFFITNGTVYLTEGYKGAPYGLSIAVRAVAGPLDLGTVIVRQAVFVDPIDAHLTAISDPLPTILQGIPLRLRTVQVEVNRPDFIAAPTSCASKQVEATFHSTYGSSSAASSRFQVGACNALKLSPKLKLRLRGRRQTKVGKHPGLTVALSQRKGQSNLKQVAVKLPLTLALDPENANGLCSYEDGLKVNCPAKSIIGKATAVSPLLNRPLTGPVYFVAGVRFGSNGRRIRTLPTLLVPLRGEIAVDLRGTSTVKRRKLVSTFSSIPDAAISKFKLSLKGGKGGILTVSNRSICSGRQISRAEFDGQNGKRFDRSIAMKRPCKKAKKTKKAKRARRH